MSTLIVFLIAVLPSGTWRLDPQRSSVEFTVMKLGTKVVQCRFREFAGEVRYDAADPRRSFVRWRVKVNSVETGEAPRDSAVRGSGYLDARRYPELTFVSNDLRPLPDGRVRIRGTISIHGRSRPLEITATPIRIDASRPVFETRFTLDRLAFDVDGASIMDNAISRNVEVRLRAVGVPQ